MKMNQFHLFEVNFHFHEPKKAGIRIFKMACIHVQCLIKVWMVNNVWWRCLDAADSNNIELKSKYYRQVFV